MKKLFLVLSFVLVNVFANANIMPNPYFFNGLKISDAKSIFVSNTAVAYSQLPATSWLNTGSSNNQKLSINSDALAFPKIITDVNSCTAVTQCPNGGGAVFTSGNCKTAVAAIVGWLKAGGCN